MKPTYVIRTLNTDPPMQTIECLVCGMKSYSPMDVSEKYCGNCHQFHEIMGEQDEHDRAATSDAD